MALSALALQRDDCVTILRTSGNFYISGCVTRAIEKVCRWSRNIEPATRAILVNHEFGYPHRDLAALRGYGVPIIEDACHSFLADTADKDMGRIGDFVLFSLPKVFPIQMGGLLAYDGKYEVKSSVTPGSELETYLGRVISRYLPDSDAMRTQRIANHNILCEVFSHFTCQARFELLAHDVPGVFLFNVPAQVDLQGMKAFGWAHGIECSVFYGENCFFIPVHHRLQVADIRYFATVFGRYLDGGH